MVQDGAGTDAARPCARAARGAPGHRARARAAALTLRPARGGRAVLAALLVLLAACAHRGPPREDEERPPRGRAEERARPPAGEEGIASFYGRRFHGRRTASGVRYDMHALTCAHPSAPFGTRLRVTDLESGRTVVVTVNDRGPYARGRVVDLSLEAARRLGMIDRGLARVRVERLPAAPREGAAARRDRS